MRPTDFCHLTFFVRAPAPRWFPLAPDAFAPSRTRISPGPRQDESLRWVAHTLSGRHGGRCLPATTRANRTPDTPSLPRLRLVCSRRLIVPRSPRPPPSARVNDAHGRSDPGCLPSNKDRRPATPFRASGSGLHARRDLAAATCAVDTFSSPQRLAELESQVPATHPVASGRRASLDLGVACRLLQPFIDARAHPTSLRHSHASGAFAALLASTNRCWLRWPPRCVTAPGASEPRSVHTDFRSVCPTCVDETNHGPRCPSKV